MALERFLVVRFPLRTSPSSSALRRGCPAPSPCSSSGGRVVGGLCGVGVMVGVVYLPQLWTNTMSTQHLCQYKEEYADFMNTAFFWLAACVYAFLPFALLTLLNVLLARVVSRSLHARQVPGQVSSVSVPLVPRNQQQQQHNHGEVEQENDAATRQRLQRNIHAIQTQVNVMLLSATVVFLILTFPICIYMLVDPHWPTSPGYSHSSAVKFLCQQIAFVLVDSTHAVNFYLYFLTARRFRHHFLRLFACGNHRRQHCCHGCCAIKALCWRARGSNPSVVEHL